MLDQPQTLSPSNLGGDKFLPGEVGDSEAISGVRRGLLLHRLLEHLPSFGPQIWPDMARQLLSTDQDPPTEAEVDDLLAEASGVLSNPELSFLFDPDALAEVDVTAQLPEIGDQRISGTIDCLIVGSDRVLIVDFKSNRIVPTVPEMTPSGLLRQMGAYRSAISQIYPNHQIDTAILWTRTASLMMLPHDIVSDALRDTTTS
jgi:ATP-dependent helicase/nuclease subunit A